MGSTVGLVAGVLVVGALAGCGATTTTLRAGGPSGASGASTTSASAASAADGGCQVGSAPTFTAPAVSPPGVPTPGPAPVPVPATAPADGAPPGPPGTDGYSPLVPATTGVVLSAPPATIAPAPSGGAPGAAAGAVTTREPPTTPCPPAEAPAPTAPAPTAPAPTAPAPTAATPIVTAPATSTTEDPTASTAPAPGTTAPLVWPAGCHPSLTLDPAAGPLGTTVTETARCFPALVTLTFTVPQSGGQGVRSAETDASGTASTRFTYSAPNGIVGSTTYPLVVSTDPDILVDPCPAATCARATFFER